jgi:hypothetical protein
MTLDEPTIAGVNIGLGAKVYSRNSGMINNEELMLEKINQSKGTNSIPDIIIVHRQKISYCNTFLLTFSIISTTFINCFNVCDDVKDSLSIDEPLFTLGNLIG